MLWVLGDNRTASMDSRQLTPTPDLGFVPEAALIGRVTTILSTPGPS
jgi:hypothetical protein